MTCGDKGTYHCGNRHGECPIHDVHRYHVQQCGEQWYIAGGIGEDTLLDQATEVRLWDDDVVLATVTYDDHGEPGTRGTYTITEHDLPEFDDNLTGWRDWRDALEFATGTARDEWDKD